MNNFSNLINNLSAFVPFFPISIMNIGFRKLNKLFIEESIKGMDKKVLFQYLIENRIFIDSLSDKDINFYYNIFKSYKKIRLKNKIKNFFIHFNKREL